MMKLLIASTAMALVLASPVGWAASGYRHCRGEQSWREQPRGRRCRPENGPRYDRCACRQVRSSVATLRDAQGIDAGKINSLVIDTEERRRGVCHDHAAEFPQCRQATDRRTVGGARSAGRPPVADHLKAQSRQAGEGSAHRSAPHLRDGHAGNARPHVWILRRRPFPAIPRLAPTIGRRMPEKTGRTSLELATGRSTWPTRLGPKPPSATNKERPAGTSALICHGERRHREARGADDDVDRGDARLRHL